MKVSRSTMLLEINFTRREIKQHSQYYIITLENLLSHLAANPNT